jgi:hypothetical protein
MRDEATAYLEKKAETVKNLGVDNVRTLAKYGLAADEIISLGA